MTLEDTKSDITCSPWERDGLSASDKTSRWETHQTPSSKLMDTILKRSRERGVEAGWKDLEGRGPSIREKGSKWDIQSIEEWKGLYGRVNPLQGRLAGAWEDRQRAGGRRWVEFSPERISRGRICQETFGLWDCAAGPRQTTVKQDDFREMEY